MEHKATGTNTNSSSDSGVMESIINLGTATTKLAIDQVQNAFTALVHPAAAIDHVRETMNGLSDAMNTASSDRKADETKSVNDLHGDLTGMDYESVTIPSVTPSWSGTNTMMNRRKS